VLKRDLKLGEELHIGDAVVRVVKKYGQTVSLVIDAPKDIKIEVKDGEEYTRPRKISLSAS